MKIGMTFGYIVGALQGTTARRLTKSYKVFLLLLPFSLGFGGHAI
jgi:hypothetical protein